MTNKLDADSALFLLGNEILHRLMQIEPGCLSLDHEGEGSIFTTTEEGKFLSHLMDMIDDMRIKETN
jgi:hypothetical protein